MIQSGGSLPDKTSIGNFVNFPLKVLESYSKALDNIDTEKKIKIIMRKIFLQIQDLM